MAFTSTWWLEDELHGSRFLFGGRQAVSLDKNVYRNVKNTPSYYYLGTFPSFHSPVEKLLEGIRGVDM